MFHDYFPNLPYSVEFDSLFCVLLSCWQPCGWSLTGVGCLLLYYCHIKQYYWCNIALHSCKELLLEKTMFYWDLQHGRNTRFDQLDICTHCGETACSLISLLCSNSSQLSHKQQLKMSALLQRVGRSVWLLAAATLSHSDCDLSDSVLLFFLISIWSGWEEAGSTSKCQQI